MKKLNEGAFFDEEIAMKSSFRTIYKMLSLLDASIDNAAAKEKFLSPDALNVSPARFLFCIEAMQDAGLMKGAEVLRCMGCEPEIDLSDAQITLEGMKFLAENSALAKIGAAADKIIRIVK